MGLGLADSVYLLYFILTIILIHIKYDIYRIYGYRYNIKESLLVVPSRLSRIIYSNDIPRTNCNDIQSEKDPREFITWNIQCLFFYVSPKKTDNLIRELRKLKCDFICLQEVFEDSIKSKLISELNDIYPYYLLGNTKKKYKVGEDSGILVLSKYNIVFNSEYVYENPVSVDRIAGKGILYFSIGRYNFATSHTQADDYKVSSEQVKEIYRRSPFDNFIILGDLNNQDVYNILNIKSNNNKKTHDDGIIDYIVPINYKHLQMNVVVIPLDIDNITDHKPLYAMIKNSQQPESNR
tara:strand:+ start:33 stop:914 length:882 start_codon:yes stop_codon:yes gene_type:complete